MSTYEDIRNILNRIDGINAPVQEDPGLTDIQKQGLKTVYEKCDVPELIQDQSGNIQRVPGHHRNTPDQ